MKSQSAQILVFCAAALIVLSLLPNMTGYAVLSTFDGAQTSKNITFTEPGETYIEISLPTNANITSSRFTLSSADPQLACLYHLDSNLNSTDNTMASQLNTEFTEGKSNQAVLFNGQSSKLAIPVSLPESGTIDLWINLNANKRQFILGSSNDGAANSFDLALTDDGTMYLRTFDENGIYRGKSKKPNFDLNQWYYITITWDTHIKVYINGTEFMSQPLAIPATNILYFGSDAYAAQNTVLSGAIDEIRILNYALNSTEVAQAYAEIPHSPNYIASPYIDIATDGKDWSQQIDLSTDVTNLTKVLNSLLLNCDCANCTLNTTCTIPIAIGASSAGILNIDSVEINYDIIESPIEIQNAKPSSGGTYTHLKSESKAVEAVTETSAPTNTLAELAPTVVVIADEDSTLTQISAFASYSGDPKIKTSKVSALPKEVPQLATPVYQYLELASEEPVNKALIKFKVKKSWVDKNAENKDMIALYRFSDGGWLALPTKAESEDSVNIYFEAESPGFSYFAIAGNVTKTSKNWYNSYAFIIIAVLTAAALAIYYIKKRKTVSKKV